MRSAVCRLRLVRARRSPIPVLQLFGQVRDFTFHALACQLLLLLGNDAEPCRSYDHECNEHYEKYANAEHALKGARLVALCVHLSDSDVDCHARHNHEEEIESELDAEISKLVEHEECRRGGKGGQLRIG